MSLVQQIPKKNTMYDSNTYLRYMMIQKRHYQIRCQKHIVEASANSLSFGNDFNNLITHAFSCTLKDDMCVRKYEGLRFGSIHEVIKVED